MSGYSKQDEEKRLCNEWLKDPLTNPKTGMPIELKGPTYKEWQERCKKLGLGYKPVKTKEFTFRKCSEWRKAPHINPETGKQITVGGTLYKRIEKACKSVTEKQVKLLGVYFIPDSSGLVPAVQVGSNVYIVRHSSGQIKSGCIEPLSVATADHLVYGPLNSLTYKNRTKLIYFKDTWDYRQGYYRPVFRGISEPKRPTNYTVPPTRTASTHSTSYSTPSDTNVTRKLFKSLLKPSNTTTVQKAKVDKLVNLFIR